MVDTDTPGDTDTDTVEVVPDGDAPEELADVPTLLDHPSGLYDAPFTATLASPLSRGEVRYTLDGTDPVDGIVYTEPLSITTTTILRATVVVDGVAALPTETVSWLFPADVPNQTRPAGWPTEWWTDMAEGPYLADYEMDPEVTTSASYLAAAPTLFTDLPVLSLVLDPDDLFGEREGIHENSTRSGAEWERAGVATILEGGESVTIACGVRLHGGSSRYPQNSVKKGFRLRFDSDYGAGDLDYAVFPDSDVTEFETLVLRAGYNRSWAHSIAISRTRADYVRERFGNEIYRQMGQPAPHVRYAQLFLNGMYWGMYQIEERPDADFLAAYLGGEPEEWDAIDGGELKDGDLTSWTALQAAIAEDLSDPDNYAAVEDLLDLDAFADYILLNLSLGNVDWPDRNWWAAHRRADGERWRFVTWDNEYIIVGTDDMDLDATWVGSPGEIFQALRANPEFRVRFGDSVQRHHFGAGALTGDSMVATYSAYATEIITGILGESARWGDHWRDVRGAADAELYTYDNQWMAEVTRITTDYLPNRGAYAVDAYRDAGLYPEVDAPVVSPLGGTVTAGTRVTIEGEDILYTLDGTDPRAPGGGVAPGARVYDGPLSIDSSATLLARTHDDDDDDDGGWSALVEAPFTVE